MATLTNTFLIEADIKQKKHIGKPVVTANDTSTFIVSVQDNGVPMDMSKVTKAVLVNLCPDRQVFETVGVIDTQSKRITFDLTAEATAVAGTVRATVQLHGTNERVSTVSFNYEVAKDLKLMHTPTVREKTLIEVALQDGPLYIEQAKTAAAKAEKVATENKTRWRPAVDTVALRNSTYPNPEHGDTVRVNSEATIYRFETGIGWIVTDKFSPTAIDNVAAQLADTASQVGGVNLDKLKDNTSTNTLMRLSSKKIKQPLVTFIDDDGKSEVWTRLKPIFESRGVPCTLAIVSDWVGTPGFMNQRQVLELQNNSGWEIASHEKTHIAMGNVVDDATIEREIVQSKRELLEMGLNVSNIVYPFGQTSTKLLAKVAEYYNFGTTTNALTVPETNNVPLKRTRLVRTALGSFAGTSNTLAHYKAAIDQAIAENSWLIFMTHVADQDLTQDGYLAQTIDYAIEKNVKVVNLKDGVDYFSDRIDLEGILKVDVDGKTTSEKFVIGIKDTLIDSATKANDIAFIRSKYADNNIIYTSFAFNNSAGMPGNTAGMLQTNFERTESGYVTQEYRIYDTGEIFRRTYTSAKAWTAWESADAWKAVKKPTKKSVIVPQLVFAANETKVVVIDLSGIGNLSRNMSIVATCQGSQVDSFSYNVRVDTASTAKLRITNLTAASITFFAIDWDFTVFWN